MTLPAKVLIVDDLEEIRWLLSELLRREGTETKETEDGETALSLISLESPDVVLMDIQMPGMNGLESYDWPGNVRELRIVVRRAAFSRPD